nr:PREDICTED: uncharacterized protein LOC657152 [Tribolium castaneum]|eukprot:XP_015840237.1 PREDICTED: uncharacterized protein LOC657152 [Tribolium castaneum]
MWVLVPVLVFVMTFVAECSSKIRALPLSNLMWYSCSSSRLISTVLFPESTLRIPGFGPIIPLRSGRRFCFLVPCPSSVSPDQSLQLDYEVTAILLRSLHPPEDFFFKALTVLSRKIKCSENPDEIVPRVNVAFLIPVPQDCLIPE